MYGPPTLPATGSWLLGPVAGLFLGASLGSGIILGLSLFLIGTICVCFFRLRRGEKKIAERRAA